jgi:hypothetical protein
MIQKTVKSGEIRREKNKYFYSKIAAHRHPVPRPRAPVLFVAVHRPPSTFNFQPSTASICSSKKQIQITIQNKSSTPHIIPDSSIYPHMHGSTGSKPADLNGIVLNYSRTNPYPRCA